MPQEIIIFLLFILFLFAVKFIWYYRQRARDDSMPIAHYQASVTAKRKEGTLVRRPQRLFVYNLDKHLDKYCYITFDIPSIGGKKEYCVPAHEYQMVAEGDCVVLTLQGTRYIGFEKR